jgi:hypoxanthine phosphoribosyltransferase
MPTIPCVSPKLFAAVDPVPPEAQAVTTVDGSPVTTAAAVERLLPRATQQQVDLSLRGLIAASLPDKAAHVQEWIDALAAPSVCVTSVDDVRRLDPTDIGSLPVPPLVKSLFRQVIEKHKASLAEQQAVLDATRSISKAFLEVQRDRNMQPRLDGSTYFQDQKNYRLILTKDELDAGVRIVARRIENWSKGERIVLVGILKGAFMFLSDLCRALTRPYSVYFVEASSYKDSRTQGEGVSIAAQVASSKFCDSTTQQPHKIVLIDELLDNGKTMHEIKQYFVSALSSTHKDNDILTCCLMSKKRERDWPEADITGIPDLPDLWLVGYGLDDRGTKRGWDQLFAIPKVKIVETIDQRAVEELLAHLDVDAALTSTVVFSGVELTCSHKQRYRLFGLDVLTGHAQVKPRELQATTKADVLGLLGEVQVVKGRYEHELQFAFIPQDTHLVPEDAIFSGDNKIFAEMRCDLRRYIAKEARRFNVPGPSSELM